MSDRTDDPRILALWAAALKPHTLQAGARDKLMAALEREPHLPFCDELARHFDLSAPDMRALLARIGERSAWSSAAPPVLGLIDFEPGPGLRPLRGGFLRLAGGAHLPRHRHTDRELTFVLEGELVDGERRRFTAGSAIDMPAGSIHTLGVPEGGAALVALLHGRIELLSAD